MQLSRLLIAAASALALCPAMCARAALVDFTPDNRQLAYESPGGLILTTLNGGLTESVPGGERCTFLRWSPTGRQLALFTRNGTQYDMKLYNPATRKTRGVGGNLRPPFAWREDGNRFACVHDRIDGKAEIVWYNLTENGVSFRVDLPYTVDASAPMVWLPTTDDLAFVASDHNVYTAESGEFKKVTTSSDVLGLSLYASGKKLVWARRGPNLRYILMSVYAYDLTSRGVARLGFPDRVPALNPDPRTAPQSVDQVLFSPDGSRLLLFVTLASGKGPRKAVYTVSMDGRHAKSIFQAPPGSTSADGLSAAWSHDSQTIALRASTSSSQSLVTASADGSNGSVRLLESRP